MKNRFFVLCPGHIIADFLLIYPSLSCLRENKYLKCIVVFICEQINLVLICDGAVVYFLTPNFAASNYWAIALAECLHSGCLCSLSGYLIMVRWVRSRMNNANGHQIMMVNSYQKVSLAPTFSFLENDCIKNFISSSVHQKSSEYRSE